MAAALAASALRDKAEDPGGGFEMLSRVCSSTSSAADGESPAQDSGIRSGEAGKSTRTAGVRSHSMAGA